MDESILKKIYATNFNTWANESNKLSKQVESTLTYLEVPEEKAYEISNFVYDAEYIGFKKGFKIAFKLFQECGGCL